MNTRILLFSALLIILTFYSYKAYSQTEFIEHTIDNYSGGSGCIIAYDIDKDGDEDILSASLESHQIVWFHHNTSEEDSTIIVWDKEVIGYNIYNAHSVAVADFDNDGDNDIIGGQYWGTAGIWIWENLFDSTGEYEFVKDTVTLNLLNVHEVTVFDLDGDAYTDILAVSSDSSKICWYRNNGTYPLTWTEHVIDSVADNAKSAVAADVDMDGDLDVIGTAIYASSVYCYFNDSIDADGTIYWTKDTIDGNFTGAHSVQTAYIDADSLPDILATAYLGHKVAWWRNAGVADDGHVVWEKQTIQYSFGNACFARAIDIDNDGLNDVVATSQRDDIVAWWKHSIIDGEHVWDYNVITDSLDRPWPLFLTDIDNDGLNDVITGSSHDGDNQILWFENNLDDTLSVNDFNQNGNPDLVYVSIIPNPCNDVAIIEYRLEKPGPVSIDIYDLHGNAIDRVFSGIGNKGFNRICWYPGNVSQIQDGIYICRIKSGNWHKYARLMVVGR